MGAVRLAAKVSPTLFLSVASVCLVAALIAVPFGKVIIVVGSSALATTAGFAAAAGFAVSVSFAALLASVAVFEQPAAVKTAAAAKASQRLRCTRVLNTSHLQRGTLGVNGMRWLVGPFTGRRYKSTAKRWVSLTFPNRTESRRCGGFA